MSSPNEAGSSPLAQADRWHFSFAGLLLLLFGLFVLLYAVSQAQVLKLKTEVEALEAKLRTEKAKPVLPAAPVTGGSGDEGFESIQANEALQTVILRQVETLQRKVLQGKKENWIEAEPRPDGGMLLRVVAPDLYRPGDAKVSERQRELIEKLGEAIRDTGRRIRIEADADDEDAEFIQRRPDAGASPNTWDLSARRAAWVAQFWAKKFNFDPAKMEVVAFGRFRGGKRRLEVIILRKGQ